MASPLSTRGLATVTARRPWLTLLAWVIGLGALATVAFSMGSVFTSEIEFTNNEEAQVAKNQLEAVRGKEPLFEQVVVQSADLTVDDPRFETFVASLLTDLRSLEGDVEFGTSFYESDDPSLVSEDRHTTLVPVKLVGDIDSVGDHIDPLIETLHERNGQDGFTVVTAGFASINHTFETIAESDLAAEQQAMPIALIVLVLVFGAVVAAIVPIVLALVAILLALALAALLSNAFPVSIFITNMIFMIGLALGIDYTLFIVERFREERRHGREKLEAIAVAGDTAGRAVLFSGLTVIISLLGMLIVPTNIFRSLGTGAIFAAVASLLICLTLLPAVLSILGDNVNRLTVPFMRERGQHLDDGTGIWAAMSRFVMGHAVVGVVAASAFLVLLVAPYFGINLGAAGASTFPHETDAYKAFEILNTEFSVGQSIKTEIVVTADDVTSGPVAGAIQQLEARIADPSDEILPAPGPTDGPSADGKLYLISVALPGDSASDEALDALKVLRNDMVPAAFAGVDAEVNVGGQTALNADFFAQVDRYTPIVFVFVLGLSFLLLLMVFRSIIVPVKAIIMNLLSVGAAYGMLVLIFQRGVGADLFGFQQVDTIEAWVPLFLFMILFGLSMDYHVFLLSRIRERYDHTHDNAGSVAFGLRSTANIITGAALIMIVVFGGFALGDLVMFQQFGFGLAFAVLLDATVVRLILVPSAMELLGDRNWYLPSWLHWLPDLRVEGPATAPQSPAMAAGDE
ncbi:MAG: MMPL family transporter [Dehalococcoidia bacterium]